MLAFEYTNTYICYTLINVILQQMNIQQLANQINWFDYYYEMSDSYDVYREGSAAEKEIAKSLGASLTVVKRAYKWEKGTGSLPPKAEGACPRS